MNERRASDRTKDSRTWRWLLLAAAGVGLCAAAWEAPSPAARSLREADLSGRQIVVFWHKWGGDDGRVVDEVVERFNRSQERYFVQGVSMPGHNLDVKLFLSISGGDPPDVVNQDAPIVADWAGRGALLPLSDLAQVDEIAELESFLFPAAVQLGKYDGRWYALCNGLDIRALYYNQTILDEYGLAPPRTIAELDRLAETIAPPGETRRERYGFLPDPRRLWAYGAAFGGRFYDSQTERVTADDPRIVRALEWMQSYSRRYGAAQVQQFRSTDQKLPGQEFPLLAGRYAVVMDGQWRIRDLARARAAERAAGRAETKYGVCAFPPPPGGAADAGWVNGNFFVVPRGARNRAGAWEFMKFWSGLGHERQAAEICVAGGWIPVSPRVADRPEYQEYLQREPLMREFVRLAAGREQLPTPLIPAAPYYVRELTAAAERAMYDPQSPSAGDLLRQCSERVQQRLDAWKEARRAPR